METGATQQVALPDDYISGWIVGADGSILARAAHDTDAKTWRLLLGNSRISIADKKTDLGEVDFLGLGRTPDTVLVQDSTGDKDVLEEYPAKPASTPTVLLNDVQVDGYLFDPDTHVLIGAATDDERGTVFFDPGRQAKFETARRAFKGYQVKLVTANEAFDKLVVFTDGGDDAGTFWLVDLATGKASELDEAYPAVRPQSVGPTRMFDYAASDGMGLQGVLTTPAGKAAANLPLIVFPHGGPIGVHDKVGFDWWAQGMASRGYAVFQPNFRGSGGYSVALRKASRGEWGRKMQTDLSDGVAALARAGIVDPKRVCIVGASYGGYAALAGVTIQSGIYRCAVSYAGLSDLGRMMDEEASNAYTDVGRYFRTQMGVSYPGDPRLANLSPAHLADKASAPILLIHGEDDTVVSPSQSEEMDGRLQLAGKPHDYVTIKGEDHWLTREPGRIKVLHDTMAFVQKYNPPD